MFGTGWNTGGVMQQPKVEPATPMTKPVRPGRPAPGAPGTPWAPPGGATTPPGRRPVRKPPVRPGAGPVTKPWAPGGGGFDFLKPFQGPTPGTAAPPPTAGPPGLPFPPPGSAPPPGTQPPPGAGPQPSTPYTPPPGTTPGAVTGARVHHDMGEGASYGQTRMNNGQKEMWGNLTGGRYGWVPWDPRMQDTADMFSRYGNNWYSGSGATSMHTSDIREILRENLGREPTKFEIEDVYYGINRGVPGVAYNS